MTNREFISLIKNNLSSYLLDDYISNEYIYNVAIPIVSLLLKREAQSRSLFNNTSIMTTLNCIQMIDADLSNCANCHPSLFIKRSKNKLPTTILTNYGSLIKVYNISRDVNYIETTVSKYSILKNQKYKSKINKYFWIEDSYLYIPDSTVEIVIVSGLFTDADTLIENLGTNSDGSKNCTGILDLPFPIPNHLIAQVVESTTNQVLMSKKINKDENVNLNNLDKN